MNNQHFVFFGCSWTDAKTINLQSVDDLTNSYEELENQRGLAGTCSYRALIRDHFEVKEINFSQGASSNDRQFRLASEYFIGPRRSNRLEIQNKAEKYQTLRGDSWPTVEEFVKQKLLPTWVCDELRDQHCINDFEAYRDSREPTVVLWFITSTARKEFFNSTQRQHENELFGRPTTPWAKMFVTDYYDHDYELERLSQQMVLWNNFFDSKQITNIWIDTFNHHDYPIWVDRRLQFANGYSDIMSNLCIINGYTPNQQEMHLSLWQADDARSKFLLERGLLNPWTLHPTAQGHRQIADMLIPLIEQQLCLNSQ